MAQENIFKKLGVEILIGLMLGGAFILFNAINPNFTIGFPYVPQAVASNNYTVIDIVAPIAEELFLGLVLFFTIVGLASVIFHISFDTVVERYLWIILLICAVVFALFHAVAYAGSLSIQGVTSASEAFLAAGLFRVAATYTTVKRKYNPLAAMTMHSTFNTWITFKTFVIVGGVLSIVH